ncbi:MAG: hypothetical protein IKZ87_02140 [Actinomycetaceae bacterium]|nr:hypothetical protein [Actinomycetaceae bacterium]
MSNVIRVGFDVATPIKSLETALEAVVAAQELLGTINGQLGDDRWTGASKEKCAQVHQVITMYCGEVKGLCDSVHENVVQLQMDANNFHANSSNVKMIQSI